MALLKHNNNSISNVTSFPLVPFGSPVLLATATASASASLSFNSTYINGDYQIYKFEFINIHPATDNVNFTFNMSTDNGSSYSVTKTTTAFTAYHAQTDAFYGLNYETGFDLAQSTAFQPTAWAVGNDNDQSVSGSMSLFNPSSSVFVKHFMSTMSNDTEGVSYYENFTAGYGNTTSSVNAIQFKYSSGNIDAGQIKLYGLGAN